MLLCGLLVLLMAEEYVKFAITALLLLQTLHLFLALATTLLTLLPLQDYSFFLAFN